MRTAVGVVVGLLLVVGIWALLLRGGEDTAGRAPDAEPRPPAENEGQPILKGQAVPSDAEAQSLLPDKEETDRLSIAGRILNERRFPVAGAVVVTKSVDGQIDRAVSGEDGRFRLAVPKAGTWTMSVFMQGHVPLVVPSVEVPAAGVKDLGTLTLSEGALLTIRLHSDSGKTPPWLHTQATHLGEPAYTANAMRVEPGDPPVVKVYGLGPGRFRLQVMSPPGPGEGTPALDREIGSDGSTPITLDLNLP